MVRSMTGYGSVKTAVDGWEISFEIKSVNHRYFDFSSRIPRTYGFLEDRIKRHVQTFISRGKVDVYLSLLNTEDTGTEIQLDSSLLKKYMDVLDRMHREFGLKDDRSVMSVARFTDIFQVQKQDEDQETLWNLVKNVADEALASFMEMRTTEGAKLCQDLLERSDFIRKSSYEIEKYSSQAEADYREKIHERMKTLLEESQIDENRILAEAALFADKINITEELVRLRSHMDQFEKMLREEKPVGRKLDFLIQEMNREVNTIGSKSNQIEIARLVVDCKSEIEKIREQVQNIE